MEFENNGKYYKIYRLSTESLSALNERIEVFKDLLNNGYCYNEALKYSQLFFYSKYLNCRYNDKIDSVISKYIE
jgi:hypothetical protein